MTEIVHVKLGAFETLISHAGLFDSAGHGVVTERLLPYTRGDNVFEPDDVGGNMDQAIDIFVRVVSPEDATQAERYKRLIHTINLADQLAKQAEDLRKLNPKTHLVFLVKLEIEFNHKTWAQALQQGLRQIPSQLQKLKELIEEPEAITIPELFVPSHHSYPPNHYDLCRISGSLFLTPLLKLQEDIRALKNFDLIGRGSWVVEFECEDYLFRCPQEDELKIPLVEFGIDEYCD